MSSSRIPSAVRDSSSHSGAMSSRRVFTSSAEQARPYRKRFAVEEMGVPVRSALPTAPPPPQPWLFKKSMSSL